MTCRPSARGSAIEPDRRMRAATALRSAGFTLVEIVVVLVLLGLAVGLVAPAILAPTDGGQSGLAEVVAGARDLAARRGETIRLRVEPSGDWNVEGAASIEQGTIARGRLDGFDGPPFTLVVSSIGTCGFDVRSSEAAGVYPLDPLACEWRDAGSSQP